MRRFRDLAMMGIGAMLVIALAVFGSMVLAQEGDPPLPPPIVVPDEDFPLSGWTEPGGGCEGCEGAVLREWVGENTSWGNFPNPTDPIYSNPDADGYVGMGQYHVDWIVRAQELYNEGRLSGGSCIESDACATPPPPTDVPPTDVPPTDVPPTDVPPTDVPPTDVPPTDVPPTDVPPTDVPPTDVPPTDVPPTDVPPTDVPPTATPMPTATPKPSQGQAGQILLALSMEQVESILGDIEGDATFGVAAYDMPTEEIADWGNRGRVPLTAAVNAGNRFHRSLLPSQGAMLYIWTKADGYLATLWVPGLGEHCVVDDTVVSLPEIRWGETHPLRKGHFVMPFDESRCDFDR